MLTPKIIDTVGSSTAIRGDGHAVIRTRDRFADRDVLDARETHDVAGGGLLDLHALQAVEHEQLGDARFLDAAVSLSTATESFKRTAPLKIAPYRNSAEVVARVEIRDEHLQRRLRIAARRRHVCHDRVEQRPQVAARQPQDRRLRRRSRAFVYSTGNSIWSSVASRSMNRSYTSLSTSLGAHPFDRSCSERQWAAGRVRAPCEARIASAAADLPTHPPAA